MIGVDTNVLVRFLTRDEPEQYAIAEAFFRERSATEPAYVSAVVLAEVIWVLRRAYRLGLEEIRNAITLLFETDALIVEGKDRLETSDGAISPSMIADHLIAHLCEGAGCSHLVTFDQRAARDVPGMELLT